ncbi:MAG: helix-turn-helix domain-containing protein [Alphaproteobacteria bacterium]
MVCSSIIMKGNQMQLSLSIEESCRAIGVGRTKLYQLINSGQLRAKKVDKRTFILTEDLQRFLSSLDSYPVKGEYKA